MSNHVIVIDCDECGHLLFAVKLREEAESTGYNILRLDSTTNQIVTRMLLTREDEFDAERNALTDLLQYAFELGRHFGETGELDGGVAHRRLYLGPL